MGLPALGAVLQALQPADPGLTRTVPGKRAPRGQTLREGLCGSGARAQGPSARQASSLTSLRPASPRRCPSLTDSRPRRSSHGDLGRVWTRGLQCGPLRGGRPGTRALGPSACWGSGPRSAGSQPGPTLPAPRGCRPLGGWAPAPRRPCGPSPPELSSQPCPGGSGRLLGGRLPDGTRHCPGSGDPDRRRGVHGSSGHAAWSGPLRVPTSDLGHRSHRHVPRDPGKHGSGSHSPACGGRHSHSHRAAAPRPPAAAPGAQPPPTTCVPPTQARRLPPHTGTLTSRGHTDTPALI